MIVDIVIPGFVRTKPIPIALRIYALPPTENVAPGDVVETPTLVFVVSRVRRGTAEVEVANENAFTAAGIVLVVPRV
jgi:hypothetical protein